MRCGGIGPDSGATCVAVFGKRHRGNSVSQFLPALVVRT